MSKIPADQVENFQCGNCCKQLRDESNKRAITITGYPEVRDKIQIIDCLAFIYGAWSEDFRLVLGKCFESSSEFNSTNWVYDYSPISFCESCALLLTDVYQALDKFEDSRHHSSVVHQIYKFRKEEWKSKAQQLSREDFALHEDVFSDGELFKSFNFDEQHDDTSSESKYQPDSDDSDPACVKHISTSCKAIPCLPRTKNLGLNQLCVKLERLSEEDITQYTNNNKTTNPINALKNAGNQYQETMTSMAVLNEGRKRKIKLVADSDSKNKFMRNCGLPYTGRNGVLHEKLNRNPLDKACVEKCQKKGCLLPQSEKQRISDDFWKISEDNYNRQSNILLSLIEWSTPKRRRTTVEMRKKEASFYYSLEDKFGKKLPCCKTTFLNVFSINKGRLATIQQKKKGGVLLMKDRRGTHTNRANAHSEENVMIIKEHIFSFPTYMPHYCCTGNSGRLYLQPDLNASKMHRLFVERYGDYFVDFERFYKETVRNTKFRFGMPKTDMCNFCDTFYSRLSNCGFRKYRSIQKIEVEIEKHHISLQGGYKDMKMNIEEAKVNPNFVVLCLGFQKSLLSPSQNDDEEFEEMYYLRKFSSFNLDIASPASDDSTMYFWNENQGKCGGIEIGSCLLKYIFQNYSKLKFGEERTLTLWSDGCLRLSNYSIVCLLKYILHNGYFTEVNLKFLVPGHSFLQCDRHFAAIERKQKLSATHTPDDWVDVIKSSRIKNTFKVVQMNYMDFRNFGILTDLIPKPTSFEENSYNWIQMKAIHPSIILTSMSYDCGNPWVIHNILTSHSENINGMCWESKCILDLELPCAYKEELPISETNKKDFRRLMRYLPSQKSQFFLELTN